MIDKRVYHWSESKKEWILLSEMHERHIVNSILSDYREWMYDLESVDNLADILSLLKSPPSNNIEHQVMVYELAGRLNDEHNNL